MNDFSIGVINETVKDDTHALVTPDTQELVDSVEPIGSRQSQTVVDTRQVAQVEDVVEFRRSRKKISNYRPGGENTL